MPLIILKEASVDRHRITLKELGLKEDREDHEEVYPGVPDQ